ncbi:MAG TPA: citramalate synthase [Candidatus Brocadiia bacterium]|nr:citramalate synthase [Planctomycetota bacterium]MDO8094611.1 citramalate synthase [Candidatus Brocadiales bacterium]
MNKIVLYDTTLRDGSQGEGVSFSLQDKLGIAIKLDELGIDYIEGGYPFSNPKDASFFMEIKNVRLRHAKIASFGSTRKANTKTSQDPNIISLIKAETPVVTIVAKSWDFQVSNVLRTTLDENLKMVAETVEFLKSKNKEVILDAEHFFDGYKSNPEYALKVIKVGQEAGSDTIVLCDTNGGSLPPEIAEIVKKVKNTISMPIGIHTHNDCDLAVANTIAAVEQGVRHVQGTTNGFGERCGNADLCSIIPILALKKGLRCLDEKGLKKLTEVSRYVYEVANILPRSNQPFVGKSAFAHKGGLHADAVRKAKASYEHISPEKIGNERRILISELSGGASVLAKIEKYDITHDRKLMKHILTQVQDLENKGYQFEAAEASFELLVKKALGRHRTFFDLEGFSTTVEKRENGAINTIATVKIKVDGVEELTASEGDGPVNALDGALRKALERFYPSIKEMQLVDYKVRVIEPQKGTAAKVRVIIQSRDHKDLWSTVGVSENIVEASWQALVDSIEYKLLKD